MQTTFVTIGREETPLFDWSIVVYDGKESWFRVITKVGVGSFVSLLVYVKVCRLLLRPRTYRR